MKNIFLVVVLFGIVLILITYDFGPSGKVYDCRDAHWHPDVPVEVKRECAELLKEDWNKRQKELQEKSKTKLIVT